MNILSIYCSHDGCVTYISENKIIFHTQIDRYNKFKHTAFPVKELIEEIEKLEIDMILLSHSSMSAFRSWCEILSSNKKLKNIPNNYFSNNYHHLLHAYCSLTWNKKLKNILVCDGTGTKHNNLIERESYYVFDKTLNHIVTESNEIGLKYEKFTGKHFDNPLDCGKTMAWSLYNPEASEIQKNYENEMSSLIEKWNIQDSLMFTGGCAQNVLYNSKLLNKFKNLFCDPFNGDFGLSLGAANFYVNNKIKNDNIYLGIPQELDLDVFHKYKNLTVSPSEVAEILLNEPVAIFQSRSEQGQRGLGNRSLLMNPTHPEAHKKLNAIKKREWFRPFALSILKEKAHEWFDMVLDESPFMMYVFDIKENKKNILTSGLSKNNKSRIQTVSIQNNKHYYELIKSFYDLTDLPILVNTSLNLPGEVLVETLYDIKKLFMNSSLNYIYFPEIKKLIKKS